MKDDAVYLRHIAEAVSLAEEICDFAARLERLQRD
jgi:hypothetical protein